MRLKRISLSSALGLLFLFAAGVASAQPRLVVTDSDIMRSNHVLEVEAGTGVLWADPHFIRIWFPPAAGGPKVERTEGGFRTVFEKPGTYRGIFQIGWWRHGEVYPIRVIVKGGTP